jgi:vancomycin permeability regulator SanA
MRIRLYPQTERPSRLKRLTTSIALGMALLVAGLLLVNLYVGVLPTQRILQAPPNLPKSYAIVLGAGVRGETLSGALQERMNKAIELYQEKVVDKILLTGDGTDQWYNETYAMERFALRREIPRENIFVDQEGYSTATSLVRARRVFSVESAYIISQDYHLPRALWIASQLNIDAWGIPSNSRESDPFYSYREIAARMKDFVLVWFLLPLLD